MASGFVAVVCVRVASDFREFDPSHESIAGYREEAAMFLDDAVASDKEAIDTFLHETFESGNIGALRDQLSRSLSVGDIVKIEHVRTGKIFYAAVDKFGWSHYQSA